MKSKNQIKDLRALSAQELKQRGTKVAEELMKLRFRKKTGQLQQTHMLLSLRRELARIKTILTASRKSQ